MPESVVLKMFLESVKYPVVSLIKSISSISSDSSKSYCNDQEIPESVVLKISLSSLK